ncbi:MAG: TraV family lipoprotein [Desulfomicrobium apsheronum]|nr:TraV family lipoprotein [Desulfomicrobium apsheronum]
MRLRTMLLLLLVLPMAGCMNPYASKFACPDPDNGKCVSMEDAYTESMASRLDPARPQRQADSSEYQDALLGRIAGLLREPETPVVVPPKVMRVLMLPYEGEGNELFMLRYAYIFTEPPRWVLSDPLQKSQR